MAAERRELTRLVITMPPQHGKSWTTSQHFPAWYLGRHPEHSVITGAYNETKALDFGLSVKDQVNDPLFRLVFPYVSVRRDSNSALKFTTAQGGSYFAVGRGGSATGRRADLFIVDDPYKDEEEVRSDAVRRLTPSGRIWETGLGVSAFASLTTVWMGRFRSPSRQQWYQSSSGFLRDGGRSRTANAARWNIRWWLGTISLRPE